MYIYVYIYDASGAEYGYEEHYLAGYSAPREAAGWGQTRSQTGLAWFQYNQNNFENDQHFSF